MCKMKKLFRFAFVVSPFFSSVQFFLPWMFARALSIDKLYWCHSDFVVVVCRSIFTISTCKSIMRIFHVSLCAYANLSYLLSSVDFRTWSFFSLFIVFLYSKRKKGRETDYEIGNHLKWYIHKNMPTTIEQRSTIHQYCFDRAIRL